MLTRTAALTLLVVLLTVSVAGAKETAGRVTGDKVQVRAGPGTRHAVLLQVNRGDLLVVLGREGQWCRVLVPGGFACFVHRSLVQVEDEAEPVISASRVRLRVSAGKEVLPLETVLDRGQVVEILVREGDWLKIIAPPATHLYIYADYVEELGPAREYRKSLAEQAAIRRKQLVSGKTEDQLRREERERQRALRDGVVVAGKSVLAGEGDTGELTRNLRRIALETTDDLTRGYANSLLLLLGLRRQAELLREDLSRIDTERGEEVSALKARIEVAEGRYRRELENARALRAERERPFRRVGRIEKRNGKFVLLVKGGMVVHLLSERFRLQDYIGKRVGVNGRMVMTDPETGATHLMVEKLEIQPASDGRR